MQKTIQTENFVQEQIQTITKFVNKLVPEPLQASTSIVVDENDVTLYNKDRLFKDALKNSRGDLDKFRSEVKGYNDGIADEEINKIFSDAQETQPIPALEGIDFSVLYNTIKKNFPLSDIENKDKFTKTCEKKDEDIAMLVDALKALQGKNFKDLAADVGSLEKITKCIAKIEKRTKLEERTKFRSQLLNEEEKQVGQRQSR